MQYMKSTFAEEVDREKVRLAEYAEVKAPEGPPRGHGRAPRTTSGPISPPVSVASVGSVGSGARWWSGRRRLPFPS